MDPELDSVVAELTKLDPQGTKFGLVLRKTFDQLYDGQRTGRYRWDHLHKTEKTHCGTLVEINLHREFEFADGQTMDYTIADIEVDCKFSQSMGGWMIPLEAVGHLCLVVTAKDEDGEWSAGVVRIRDNLLNPGGNRDSKRTLNPAGRAAIRWLFKAQPLPPNALLQLPRATVDAIFRLRFGQQRVNQLFRDALGMRIGRGVIATVAQTEDPMKRVRKNGGARSLLQPEGIIILGEYQAHSRFAQSLGVPIPGPGESVAVRVAAAPAAGPGIAEIDGGFWRIAVAGDPIVQAPETPHNEE